MSNQPHLQRKLGIVEAVSLNMIDMVGIGPFVSLPIIMALMPGKGALLAWLLGALLALCDGLVWGELGAAYPMAGGSYNFLKEIYGKRYGRLFSFLYTWQTAIQAPLVVASGAIGFALYFQYLLPLNDWERRLVSVSLVALIYFLLNRNIASTGSISKILWAVVILIMVIIIGSGVAHFNMGTFHQQAPVSFNFLSLAACLVLGQSTVKSIYCYLGYYNVCHLGGEITNPQRNIPRSIIYSVLGIAFLYISLQFIVLGNLAPGSLTDKSFLFSILMEKWFGVTVARWFTVMVLWIAAASLFAVMLGYSRVLYAAAADGNFIPALAKVDEKKNIPHISLLWLAVAGGVFSLLFKLSDVIAAIVVVRILTQFVSQSVGLLWLQKTGVRRNFPWKMFLFPLPVLISLLIWVFVFCTSDWRYMLGALGVIASGLVIYFIKENMAQKRGPEPSDN